MAGVAAVTLGLTHGSTVLVSFGAVGVLDAVGSSALVLHFRHARKHEALHPDRERVALRVVTTGMVLVGVSSLGLSAQRLLSHRGAHSVPAGIAIAAASVVVLAALAARKHVVGTRLGSSALRADGALSATGAVLALITLVGTGLDTIANWWWADPAAALLVSCAAIALGIGLARRG